MTAKNALTALCVTAVLALGAKTLGEALAPEAVTIEALNRSSLQGMQGVKVTVTAEGFENDAVRKDVESWLKRSNVPVVTSGDDKNFGTLAICITTATRQSVNAVTINVNLLQQVHLARKPTLIWPCATWHASRTLALDKRTMKNALDMTLSSVIYDFAYAYLGENKDDEP